jgi:UDP:flavonoid glycosyltransferase YjiC (YdhE family)
MEALHHGVPMLLIPVCNDQPLQAHFVTRAGAGLELDRETMTVAHLRAALQQVLAEDGAPRRNALRVRASYRAQDGAREAASLLAALAR